MKNNVKMMIFENRVRVKNHFPVEIFENFHFQKHAPNILKTLAKKNFKNLTDEVLLFAVVVLGGGTGTCCGGVILGFISTVVLEELVRLEVGVLLNWFSREPTRAFT